MVGADGGGLEALSVVSTLLYVSDRSAETCGAILLGYGEEGYLAIESDELLDDEFLDVATASFATVSEQPETSNSILPGFTGATQYSTAPLPLPIRTSNGFLV